MDLTMILDHSTIASMTLDLPGSISISQFKATCLAVLEQVRASGRAIVITKRGKPIAEVGPATSASLGAHWMGSLEGTCEMDDDLFTSVEDPDEWTGDWENVRKGLNPPDMGSGSKK